MFDPPGDRDHHEVPQLRQRILLNRCPSTPYATARRLLELKHGDQWKQVYEDDKPKGTESVSTFPPVTRQIVRVSVDADQPGIRVAGFELIPPL